MTKRLICSIHQIEDSVQSELLHRVHGAENSMLHHAKLRGCVLFACPVTMRWLTSVPIFCESSTDTSIETLMDLQNFLAG